MPGSHSKSRRQVGYLLSNDSPLSASQQATLKSELHSGAIKVRSGPPPLIKKQGKGKGK